MGDLATSRRALLGALAIAAPTVAVAAGPIGLTCSAARSSGFPAAIARYHAARAEEEAFDDNILAPAMAAYEVAEALIPHVTINAIPNKLTTAEARTVADARRSIRGTRYVEECARPWYESMKALVDAADARLATVKALPESRVYDAAAERSDTLFDVRYKARNAALATPAATVAEMAVKFAMIEEDDPFTSDAVIDQFRADLSRLAGGQA